ncbi:hypothetical protein PanWU01x14_287370, partial [Parasponia andersonii]
MTSFNSTIFHFKSSSCSLASISISLCIIDLRTEFPYLLFDRFSHKSTIPHYVFVLQNHSKAWTKERNLPKQNLQEDGTKNIVDYFQRRQKFMQHLVVMQ